MSRLRHVALIYDAKSPYSVKVMAGVASYLHEAGPWNVFIEEESLRDQRLPDLRDWEGDGIIANLDHPRVARQVYASGIPTVAFGGGYGGYDPSLRIPYFFPNNRALARLAAKHLLDRGFRHFAYYGYPPSKLNGWSNERADEFRRCVTKAGGTFSLYEGRNWTGRQWNTLCRSLCRWLESLPKPVGLMAARDRRGRQVLEVCRAVGLRVPEEVAVVGVDNDELLCQLTTPTMTSIEQGVHRMGYLAAALLDRMMAGQKPRRLKYVVDCDRLVPRRSTDVFAVADAEVAEALAMIRQRACQGLRVAEIVETLALSRSALESRFKEAMGRTVFAELSRVRLEQARRLVAESHLSLKQIALSAGFKSVQHMTTLFGRAFHQTPGQYRRKMRPF